MGNVKIILCFLESSLAVPAAVCPLLALWKPKSLNSAYGFLETVAILSTFILKI